MKNKNEPPTDYQLCISMLICGVVGSLIGFGTHGTLQSACLGAGIGALTPILLMLLS